MSVNRSQNPLYFFSLKIPTLSPSKTFKTHTQNPSKALRFVLHVKVWLKEERHLFKTASFLFTPFSVFNTLVVDSHLPSISIFTLLFMFLSLVSIEKFECFSTKQTESFTSLRFTFHLFVLVSSVNLGDIITKVGYSNLESWKIFTQENEIQLDLVLVQLLLIQASSLEENRAFLLLLINDYY